MSNSSDREILAGLLTRVRRRILLQQATGWLVQAGIYILPIAALGMAADQRWNQGRFTLLIALAAIAILVIGSLIAGLRGLGERVRSALTLDHEANLKDRVSSAWEFLEQPELTEAQQVQIRDAVQRAEALNCSEVLRMKWPRLAAAMPVAILLFAVSFFVPSVTSGSKAGVAKDPVREAQLAQLDELKQELMAKQQIPEELQDAIKKLDEVRRQYEAGEIAERDVMLELGRLDEQLRSKLASLGIENLESEMNAIVPHLSASAATLQAAQAMKEKDFDKAAEELQKLAENVKEQKLSKEDQKQLAAHLGTAAAKLGKKSSDSFAGDLAQASEALEKSDSEKFGGACKSMGNKLNTMSKCQGLKSACNKIGLCKSGLGQCNSSEMGFSLAPKSMSKGKGGLKAGTGASGDPFGEASRLSDSYKKMLQVAGQSGQGPTETETEITEGQMSQSTLNAKDVHASYAAMAEEVIEREDIPLSHRYHVKRYFQAIRPQD